MLIISSLSNGWTNFGEISYKVSLHTGLSYKLYKWMIRLSTNIAYIPVVNTNIHTAKLTNILFKKNKDLSRNDTILRFCYVSTWHLISKKPSSNNYK